MSTAPLIYLDHNATTPLRAEVREALGRAIAEDGPWGNPSSVHRAGRAARDAVERARHEVAALVGALPEEIVFTSGGTEGDNLGIRGLALEAARTRRRADRRPHVVSSPLEHPAVHGALAELAREGFEVSLVPVSAAGVIDPAELLAALREETVLVTLALANHEIGNVYPIAALAALVHGHGALFHTDAVQAAGRIPVAFGALGVDALTLSAHKLYGPKGVGALVLRQGCFAHPVIAGGHQERERRAGTENVPGVVGFGTACALAMAELSQEGARLATLRDRLEGRLLSLPGARRHGGGQERLPGTTNLGFEGADGSLIAINLDLAGVCVSTGAACTSGSVEPSPVIRALGLPRARAKEAVRFSLGRSTDAAAVDRVCSLMPEIVERVRAASGG